MNFDYITKNEELKTLIQTYYSEIYEKIRIAYSNNDTEHVSITIPAYLGLNRINPRKAKLYVLKALKDNLIGEQEIDGKMVEIREEQISFIYDTTESDVDSKDFDKYKCDIYLYVTWEDEEERKKLNAIEKELDQFMIDSTQCYSDNEEDEDEN